MRQYDCGQSDVLNCSGSRLETPQTVRPERWHPPGATLHRATGCLTSIRVTSSISINSLDFFSLGCSAISGLCNHKWLVPIRRRANGLLPQATMMHVGKCFLVSWDQAIRVNKQDRRTALCSARLYTFKLL
jgi:hypothetical protein